MSTTRYFVNPVTGQSVMLSVESAKPFSTEWIEVSEGAYNAFVSKKISVELFVKVQALCELITLQTAQQMDDEKFTHHRMSAEHAKHYAAHWTLGEKYIRMDVGDSEKYMIEISTGNIYGIKAYGVIHRGYLFGNLDTVDEYWWGACRAIKYNEFNLYA